MSKDTDRIKILEAQASQVREVAAAMLRGEWLGSQQTVGKRLVRIVGLETVTPKGIRS